MVSQPSTLNSQPISATYSYLAKSPLIEQVVFKQGTTTRMTTSKSYDKLNRLTGIEFLNTQPATLNSSSYDYNSANQRTRVTLADGSYWLYEYDSLGQVQSGKKYWEDGTPVAGQQFEYGFDDIGNRKSTAAGGDENGLNLRGAAYGANLLNQYTNRTVPGFADIMGISLATNTVTVNGQTAYRKGEYFRKELPINNSTALSTNITVAATGQSSVTGSMLVAKALEAFWHDLDGNLLSDSLWTNRWNAENRLVQVESTTAIVANKRMREVWTHLPDGRWIERIVSTNNGTAYYPAFTNRFVWDGQVLMAILDHTNGLVMSFVRGLDLSGSIQGAGGVGGVLAVNFAPSTLHPQPSTHFVSYDGNGNVAALCDSTTGTSSGQFEYGPFSEPIRVTGTAAQMMPLRFSTMYEDSVTGDRKYLFRDLSPSTGRWKGRDPMEEPGGANLYGFLLNSPLNGIDPLGLTLADDFKEIGYRYWRWAFVKKPHWRKVMDDWYYETNANPAYFVGNSDPRNMDIANNRGFQKLLNCWIAKRRGEQVPQSSEWEVRDDGFYWHYGYWGFLGFDTSAGGAAAYDSATHFLGSYNATLTYVGNDTALVQIYNRSGWVSGTRTEGIPLIGWLIRRFGSGAVSMFENHERGAGPESPSSRGGNLDQYYVFTVHVDPCAECVLP